MVCETEKCTLDLVKKYTNEYDTLYMLHPYPTSDFKNPPFELITEIASTH